MKKNIIRELTLKEISAVDRPAQVGAKMTIMKRADDHAVKLTKYYYDSYSEGKASAKTFDEILTNIEDAQKLREAREQLYPLFDALQSSLSSIAYDTALDASKRMTKIESSVNDFLSAVRAKMPDVEEELTKALIDFTAGSSGFNPAKHKDDPMADAKTVEELQKSLETLQKSLDEAQKVAKMSDAAKAHMAKLSDEDKGKFMALSSEEQEKKVNAVKKSDETLELHGQTITKSAVGDGVFAVMKAQAAEIRKAQEEIAKARDEAETERLAKRADDELSALPGDRLAKARILKASNTLSTEDRTTFDAMLKAANSSLAKAFTNVGKSGAGVTEEGSAEDQLQKKATEIAKRDTVSFEKAYERAINENPDLYESIETPKA